jgi:hypothetical protein
VSRFKSQIWRKPGHKHTGQVAHATANLQCVNVLDSPAFILALSPSIKSAITQALWAAVLLPIIPVFIWYWNGTSQFGTRYYIQIFPFLLVLMALGTGSKKPINSP